MQIEQLKQKTQQDKNQAELQLKAQEMQMTDKRERDKIASNEKIKAAEIMARQGDAGQKAQATNMKMIHDREQHQASMIETQETMRLNRPKGRDGSSGTTSEASRYGG